MKLRGHADEIGEAPYPEDLAEALLELFEGPEGVPDQLRASLRQTHVNGPAILLRNEGGNRSHYLSVRTIGTQSNRDGIGARIKIVVKDLKQVSEVRAGVNYLSHNDLRVFFGLGAHTQVDSLEILWPSGIAQTLNDVKADQILTVTEPKE